MTDTVDLLAENLMGLTPSERVRKLRAFQVSPPWVLYKFCGPSSPNVSSIIEDSQLFLSSPVQFNDPFDTGANITFSGTAEQYFSWVYRIAIEQGNSGSDAIYMAANASMGERPDYQQIFDARIAKIGVACFITSTSMHTHAARNVLMWSHYASSHEGLCFQFSIPRDAGVLASAVPVEYSDDFVIADFAKRDEVEARLSDAVLRKAKAWEYEHERRIVRMGRSAGTKLSFEPAGLCGVIVGLRATDATVANLLECCTARIRAGLPRIRLFRAERVPGHYRLQIRRARDLEQRAYAAPG